MKHINTALLCIALFLTASPALCQDTLIPGWRTLNFKAGETVQEVSFRNPPQNECCFRISITLEDGTELWRSKDLLKPGEAVTRIELVRTLEGGIYRNALMRYECFTLDGKQKLNGADLRVTVQAD